MPSLCGHAVLGDRLFQMTLNVHSAVKDTENLDLTVADDKVRDPVVAIENLADLPVGDRWPILGCLLSIWIFS